MHVVVLVFKKRKHVLRFLIECVCIFINFAFPFLCELGKHSLILLSTFLNFSNGILMHEAITFLLPVYLDVKECLSVLCTPCV